MTSPNAADSYLIIGAGIFGASAALELRKRRPSAKVTLVDSSPFPNPHSATSDLNKIIRADYGDVFYMQLALEAQEGWRQDPVFEPFYHETGMLYAENKGMAEDFFDKYRQIGYEPASEVLSLEQARTRWRGVFRDANWEGVEKCYFNPKSGWGEGEGALRSLAQAAVDHGAEFVTGSVASLILVEGTCQGVHLSDGTPIHASNTIVATGAWTPHFLAQSAPKDKSLHVGDRMVAAGAIQCVVTYPEAEAEKLAEAPVIFNGMKHTEGESIPPTRDGKLKFNYEVSFTNNQFHEASGQLLSVPPPRPSSASPWGQDVPEVLKEEIRRVVDHTYGRHIAGRQIEGYRMCWDAVTPSQDWLISPHANCTGLFIAAGGSFHSWKFMPVIGKYVVQMLLGELEAEHADRWAWNSVGGGGSGALPEYVPRRDLNDLWKGEKQSKL